MDSKIVGPGFNLLKPGMVALPGWITELVEFIRAKSAVLKSTALEDFNLGNVTNFIRHQNKTREQVDENFDISEARWLKARMIEGRFFDSCLWLAFKTGMRNSTVKMLLLNNIDDHEYDYSLIGLSHDYEYVNYFFQRDQLKFDQNKKVEETKDERSEIQPPATEERNG